MVNSNQHLLTTMDGVNDNEKRYCTKFIIYPNKYYGKMGINVWIE